MPTGNITDINDVTVYINGCKVGEVKSISAKVSYTNIPWYKRPWVSFREWLAVRKYRMHARGISGSIKVGIKREG